jgi:hypothetical protein
MDLPLTSLGAEEAFAMDCRARACLSPKPDSISCAIAIRVDACNSCALARAYSLWIEYQVHVLKVDRYLIHIFDLAQQTHLRTRLGQRKLLVFV